MFIIILGGATPKMSKMQSLSKEDLTHLWTRGEKLTDRAK